MKNQTFMRTKAKVAAVVFSAAMAMSTAAPAVSSIPVYAATATSKAGEYGIQAESGTNAATKETWKVGTGTIMVTGVGTDAKSVKAYKIVTGLYNADGKLSKYVLVDPTNGNVASIGNSTKGQTKDTDDNNDENDNNDIITASELTTISKNIASGAFACKTASGEDDSSIVFDMTGSDGTYTATVTPGLYVIIVTTADNSTTLYNPAVAAVNVTDANTGATEGGTVDMSNYFTSYDGTNPSIAYVKKSTTPGLTKKMTGSTKLAKEAEEDTAGKGMTVKSSTGDTLAYGDSVSFEISGLTVPSYSEDYADPYFYVTDKLTPADAFTAITDIVVKNGDTTLTAETGSADWKTSEADYVLTNNGKDFKVQLTAKYLKDHRSDKVDARPQLTITYNTKLSGKADVNFAENQNHAELHYTNNAHPEQGGNGEHDEHKDNYIYTFAINSAIDAQDENNKTKSDEFVKVKSDTAVKDGETKALAGATFTLYSDADCSTPVKARTVEADGTVTTSDAAYTAVSKEDGTFVFEGLDEGTYYVKETVAPTGYTLSDEVYKFVIAATLNENGTLKDYTVDISKKDSANNTFTACASAKYSATATVDETTGAVTNTITAETSNKHAEIVNNKIQSLPFTGGEGRYAVYLTAAGFAGALGIFVALKKKNEKEEA